MRFLPEPSYGNCVPFWTPIPGRAFRNGPLAETVSHSERLFWDAVSQRALFRKACPILSLQTGMHFPVEVQSPSATVPQTDNRHLKAAMSSHVAPIETRPYNTFRTTNSHVEASASGSATAHRHAICCTVKSATGTLILCLANKVKGGRASCQDGKHRSRSCSPCSRLHLL